MNATLQQNKMGDESFRPVLADSMEDLAAAANQSLINVAQRQNMPPVNGESKLFLGKIFKSNLFVMDSDQGLPFSGLTDTANKETLLDSDVTSVPMGEATLLYRLFGESQGANRDRVLPGNCIEIVNASNTKEAGQNQCTRGQNMDLAHAEINTIQGAKTGATNQIPIIQLSNETASVQIKGEGVASDSNAVAKSIGEGLSTSDSIDENSHTDSNPKTSFLFPENLKQKEADAGLFRFVQNGTEESEVRANELAANSFEKAEIDESLQSAKLLQVQSIKKEASLFPGERVNGNVHDLPVTQHLSQMLPVNPDTKQFPGKGSWETERVSGKSSPAPKTGQSESMASSAENNIMNTVKSGEFVTSSTTGENTLLEVQETNAREESNGSLTPVKQDVETRINSITSSGNINNPNFPESLKTDVADQIVQGARLFLQGGKSEVKLQLNPPELGSLKLEFSIVDDVLEAKISVEKSLVKDTIEKDIPRLRELLSTTDVDVGRFDVTLQEKEEERQELMSKEFQPDTGSRERRNIAEGDKENFDEEGDDDVLEQNAVNSTSRINYLV